MEAEVFLDTAYAIALANAKDQFHQKAVQLAKQLRIEKTKLVTTRIVLFEIGNALSGQRFRAGAMQLLDAIEADPNVGIVSLTDALYSQALTLISCASRQRMGIG